MEGVRICFETNGLWNKEFLKKACDFCNETGGILKIDLKAFSPEVYEALTGVWNPAVRKNVTLATRLAEHVVFSILLVPGYIDQYELERMVDFVASLGDFPVVFLAFHPDYLLTDLPPTSKKQASLALELASSAGLTRVYLGNEWLLR